MSAGGAAATSPLPKFEHRVDVPDQSVGLVEDTVVTEEEVEEQCLPRDLFCVGPFKPWFEVDLGNTGFALVTDEVWLVAGHDPARKQYYGPYAFRTVSDDLRACWTKCAFPDPFYGAAHANATLYVYLLGDQQAYHVEAARSIDTLYPSVIPRTWCHWAQYSDC